LSVVDTLLQLSVNVMVSEIKGLVKVLPCLDYFTPPLHLPVLSLVFVVVVSVLLMMEG